MMMMIMMMMMIIKIIIIYVVVHISYEVVPRINIHRSIFLDPTRPDPTQDICADWNGKSS